MTGVSFAFSANDMTGGNVAGFRPPFSGNYSKKLCQINFLKTFRDLYSFKIW